MTVFNVMEKRQKPGLLPSGFFFTEIIIAKPKVNIHSLCSTFEVTFLFLLISPAELQPFVLVYPGLASIFNIMSALHAGK